MTINTAAGSSLAIGTTAAAATQTQFEADTYTQVGEIEDLGEVGDQSEDVTFNSLDDSRTRHYKGSRDAGVMTVICGADPADVGQDAMLAAEATEDDYNFRVTLNDAITATPTKLYFRGKVMGERMQIGQSNNIVRRRFDIGVNSDIVVVEAT